MSSSDSISIAISFAKITKVSRFSKIGVKSTRIMKLIRLIKLIKIFNKPENTPEANISTIKISSQAHNQPLEVESNLSSRHCQNIQQQWVEDKVLKFIKKESQAKKVYINPRQIKKKKIQSTNNNTTLGKPIISIGQTIQKVIKLTPLIRPNVDPQLQSKTDKQWQQINGGNKLVMQQNSNSKLGENLKGQIQKNLILMVIGLIIMMPMISADTWFSQNIKPSEIAGIFFNNFHQLEVYQKEQFIESFLKVSINMSTPLVYLKIYINQTCCEYPKQFSHLLPQYLIHVENLREYQKTIITDYTNKTMTIIFSERQITKINAYLNLCRSLIITILLIFSSLLFMKDLQMYALNPLEKMCTLIKKISINPFQTLKEVNKNAYEEEIDDEQPQIQLQTNILQFSVIKIIRLLIIGAGELGDALISDDFQGINSNNNIYPGNEQINGLFMYVKIVDYSQICEILDENILRFTNTLATIVHQLAIKHAGTVVENDGQGFLLFWNYQNSESTSNRKIHMKKITELAIITFLKISIAANLDQEMKNYGNLRLKKESQPPNYFLNAGIHMGSAFKSSLGSSFKMENNCISSDIIFTKSLCKLSNLYKISNIISQDVSFLLDWRQKSHIRKIDMIYIQNFAKRCEIYTADVILWERQFSEYKPVSIKKESSILRTSQKKTTYKYREQLLKKIKDSDVFSVIDKDQNLQCAQKIYSEQFYECWNEAMEKYYFCEWDQALQLFQAAYQMTKFFDGPALIMINRINESGGYPHDDWQYYMKISLD